MPNSKHDSHQDVLPHSGQASRSGRSQKDGRSRQSLPLLFSLGTRLILTFPHSLLSSQNLADAALHALLYTKPTLLAPPLRSLILELEHRSSSTSLSAAAYRAGAGGADDLAPLLGECHSAWVAMRQAMLQGVVMSEVGRLNPAKAPLVELVSSSLASPSTESKRES